MKLYTEEKVRQAFIDGMKFIAVDPLKYEQDANEYMGSLTPIELPSDDYKKDLEILQNEVNSLTKKVDKLLDQNI